MGKEKALAVRNVDAVISRKDIEVVEFSKEILKDEVAKSLKQFGRGCCDAGKDAFAPLTKSLTERFFDWIKTSVLR